MEACFILFFALGIGAKLNKKAWNLFFLGYKMASLWQAGCIFKVSSYSII